MRKSDSLSFELSKPALITLFIYFSILLLTGIVFSILIMCNLPTNENVSLVIRKTILSSLSVSAMMCSMQYIKRLYKACITDRIIGCSSPFGQLGNIVYFLLRPIYSFAFVIIMMFSFLSGMFVITGNLDYIINEKFLYLCVILASCIGYSVGDVLDKFEMSSKEKIENTK